MFWKELDKTNGETPLIQGTKAEEDELKQQNLQLHIPAQQSTLEIQQATQGPWLRLGSFHPFQNM